MTMEYQGDAFVGATLEQAGFNMIINESASGIKNTCEYRCGVDAADYDIYSAVPLGLIKDSGETLDNLLGAMTDVITYMITEDLDGVDTFTAMDYVLIDEEIIKITASNAAGAGLEVNATVERGQFGTTAAAHLASAPIYHFAKGDKNLEFWGDIKVLNHGAGALFLKLNNINIGASFVLEQGASIQGRFTLIQMANTNASIINLYRR